MLYSTGREGTTKLEECHSFNKLPASKGVSLKNVTE